MKIKSLVIILLVLSTSVNAQPTRRQLTTSLYPIIPNSDNFYRKIEMAYEKLHPEIDLVIDLNSDYYDEQAGVINDDADIYEIDCVLLKDFIKKQKIQPLAEKQFNFNQEDLMPASGVVYSEKKLFAVPHWLCGNFLFSNSSDSAMQNIKILNDLEKVIGIDPDIKGGLVMDIKGRLTVGELYVDALLDEYKTIDEVLKHCTTSTLDNITIDNLNRLPRMTYGNWGRDADYHEKIGFYQKQFARQNGRAFVGYSESLYYMIDELINSCYKEEGCLPPNNISISELAVSDKGSTPVGWVDAIAINSKVKGQKQTDAIEFINFLTSKEAYHMALIPDYGAAPRYLLPAYKRFYSDSSLLKVAPYYTQLYPLAMRITSFTEEGISTRLREIGKKLDKEYLKK